MKVTTHTGRWLDTVDRSGGGSPQLRRCRHPIAEIPIESAIHVPNCRADV